jgi:hypothetical protein
MSADKRDQGPAVRGDMLNPIVQSLIDTRAVDFDAVGKALAELGPSVGSLRSSGEDWFCTVYHTFLRIYIIRGLTRLADPAVLREMAGELNR